MLRRRTAPRVSQEQPDPAVEAGKAGGGSGKGRPTPKRREAQPKRTSPFTAPSTGREARDQRRRARLETRAALQSGDESRLPSRDRGPVRRFVRDYVDSRRLVAEFLLPVGFVLYILVFAGQKSAIAGFASVALMALFAVLILEMIWLGFGVRRAVRQQFPDESVRGLAFYAITRAPMLRRWRLPPPRVKPGQRAGRKSR